MARKDKMTNRQIAYCGRRLSHKQQLMDAFAIVGELDDLLFYKAARRCPFVIGQIYNAKISPTHTMDFSSFEEDCDNRVPDGIAIEWSTKDAVSRRAKENESSRTKAQKECRQRWLEVLEPIRMQYRQMSAPKRRALRQLIIEWIES